MNRTAVRGHAMPCQDAGRRPRTPGCLPARNNCCRCRRYSSSTLSRSRLRGLRARPPRTRRRSCDRRPGISRGTAHRGSAELCLHFPSPSRRHWDSGSCLLPVASYSANAVAPGLRRAARGGASLSRFLAHYYCRRRGSAIPQPIAVWRGLSFGCVCGNGVRRRLSRGCRRGDTS